MDKEASKKGAIALTRAYGYEDNDWDPNSYLELVRTVDSVFAGSVEFACCATVFRREGESEQEVLRQWLNWSRPPQQGPEVESLAFWWTVDRRLALADFAPPLYFFQGKEVGLEALKNTLNYQAASATVRIVVPGMPGLAKLALRSSQMSCSHGYRIQVNEPVLFVPKRGMYPKTNNLVEDMLHFIFSGMGPAHSPMYYRLRELTWGEFELTPWEMFKLAGFSAAVFMSDLGRVPRRLAKLHHLARGFLQDPHGMMGLKEQDLRNLQHAEGSRTANRLVRSVPWFVVDEQTLGVPNYKDCCIVARRVDSCRVDSQAWIPALELGFMPAEAAEHALPAQKAPQEIEIKPQQQIPS